MKYKFLICLIPLFLCVLRPAAQQAKPIAKKINLSFDSAGRLVSFPPAVLRKHKKVCPQVVMPASAFYKEVARFRGMLLKTYTRLIVPKTYNAYYCFYEDKKDLNFPMYVKELEELIKLLDEQNFKDKTKAALIASVGNYKYVPAAAFLSNLFNKQFAVRISWGATTVRTDALNEWSYDKKNNCFYFTSSCHKVEDLLCHNCGNRKSDQLSFLLIKTNPLDQTLKEWFEVQNDTLNTFNKTTIGRALEKMAGLEINDPGFATQLSNTRDLNRWYPYWFWYTEGEFVIDPFKNPTAEGIKALKDKIKGYNRAIDSLRMQKAFIDSALVKVDESAGALRQFRYTQDISISLADQIDSLTGLKEEDTKKLSARSSLFPNTQPRFYLNNVTMFLTYHNHVRPLVQFDGSNEYQPTALTKRELNRVTELPDNERGVILLHNIDSSVVIKLDQRRTSFKDNEEFTEWVAEQLSKIDLTSLTGKEIPDLQSFVRSFISSADTKGLSADTILTCPNGSKNLVYAKILKLAQAYAAQTATFYYENSVFSDAEPKGSLYRSQAELVKFNFESPFKDSISINQVKDGKETTLMQAYVKVGKLRFIEVAAGIAMTSQPVTTTAVDTTGNGFRMSTTDNKAKTMIGFKVYPFQHYTRDRWLLPRYPLRRISVFGGFEMLHPLDNFYLGGCYDIVPGLGFTMGANFYLQTSYKVENNVVTDTYRNYSSKGVYYGVVVNPVLFVQFVKLLF